MTRLIVAAATLFVLVPGLGARGQMLFSNAVNYSVGDRPEGGILFDFDNDGDGEVNVNDLLQVVTNWS